MIATDVGAMGIESSFCGSVCVLVLLGFVLLGVALEMIHPLPTSPVDSEWHGRYA